MPNSYPIQVSKLVAHWHLEDNLPVGEKTVLRAKKKVNLKGHLVSSPFEAALLKAALRYPRKSLEEIRYLVENPDVVAHCPPGSVHRDDLPQALKEAGIQCVSPSTLRKYLIAAELWKPGCPLRLSAEQFDRLVGVARQREANRWLRGVQRVKPMGTQSSLFPRETLVDLPWAESWKHLQQKYPDLFRLSIVAVSHYRKRCGLAKTHKLDIEQQMLLVAAMLVRANSDRRWSALTRDKKLLQSLMAVAMHYLEPRSEGRRPSIALPPICLLTLPLHLFWETGTLPQHSWCTNQLRQKHKVKVPEDLTKPLPRTYVAWLSADLKKGVDTPPKGD